MSKVLDSYEELKNEDKDLLYLFGSGIFYLALNEDANILHEKLGLKLTKFTDDVNKCGFPKHSLDNKYKELFDKNDIKYKVIEMEKKEKVIKKEASKNLYELKEKHVPRDKIEETVLYAQYIELIKYTGIILEKYPRVVRHTISDKIINTTYEGMELFIRAYQTHNNKQSILNDMDIKMKFLKVLVRISYKNKYINSNNYSAWSKKLMNITNMLKSWSNKCPRV